MGRLFGTDGVRGLANADLTPELALDLAVAAANVLGDLGGFVASTYQSVSGAGAQPVAIQLASPSPAKCTVSPAPLV